MRTLAMHAFVYPFIRAGIPKAGSSPFAPSRLYKQTLTCSPLKHSQKHWPRRRTTTITKPTAEPSISSPATMSAERWDSYAESYGKDAHSFTKLHAADLLSAIPAIKKATTILEIACGTGAFANAYLDAFPHGIPGQTIIFTDFSKGMVSRTEQYVRSRIGAGFETKVKFQVADGTDLKAFEDESVDVVVSVFGVFLIPDGVVPEIWRVLKKEGIFGNASWTDLGDDSLHSLGADGFGVSYNRSVGAAFQALMESGDGEGKFKDWGVVEKVKKIYEEGGFGKVRVFRNVHSVGFEGVERLWELISNNAMIDGEKIGQEKKDKVKGDLKKAMGSEGDDEVTFLLTAANVAVGTKCSK